MDYSNRILDRVKQFDEKSRRFAAVSPDDTRNFRSYTWSCKVYNDQLSEGACVGFAWSHELSARPKIVLRDADFARQVYHRAQQIDEWAGEDYEGTSVLAGIKAVMEIENSKGRPLIQEYRWGFGIQDVLRILGYQGPVVLGINWYNAMFRPDDNGFIRPMSGVAGGHAILANGVKIVKKASGPASWDNLDIDKSYVRLHNSWGTGYGVGGDAFITVRNLDFLLEDDGEACIPVIRSSA